MVFILVHLGWSFRRSTSARPTVLMGWSDKNWNWGSANGDAHDVAMITRQKFGTEADRSAYIKRLCETSLSEVEVEELKMVLALRFQRAAREGKDGDGKGWEIMSEMAKCKYENEGISSLTGDLLECTKKLPMDLVALASNEEVSSSLPTAAARCLAGTDFIRIGL